MKNGIKITVRGSVRVLARARAFRHEGIRQHSFSVDADGTVRVFDAVAGHYTTCHSLSKSSEARIRKLAK